jgi:hypothetical protein
MNEYRNRAELGEHWHVFLMRNPDARLTINGVMARTGLNEEEVLLFLIDAWASDYLLPDTAGDSRLDRSALTMTWKILGPADPHDLANYSCRFLLLHSATDQPPKIVRVQKHPEKRAISGTPRGQVEHRVAENSMADHCRRRRWQNLPHITVGAA